MADYKQEYLKLKKKIMEDFHYGNGKLNSKFLDAFQNLVFVVDDNILGDDAEAIILSLVDEFNKIAETNLVHNIELSQYYDATSALPKNGNIFQCENCEIVLKYIDTTICLTNSRVRRHINNDDANPNDPSNIEIDCNASRGLVQFYIKQKLADTYKYRKIQVVKILRHENLLPFLNTIYQNNDEFAKLNDAANVAIAKWQTKNLSQSRVDPEKIKTCPIEYVNNIINDTKQATTNAQISKINISRFFPNMPTISMVNTANSVAKNISTITKNKLVAILVPGNEAIPVQSNLSTGNVPAIVKIDGSVVVNSNENNTLNSNKINHRASIMTDANLAMIPFENIINDNRINIKTTPVALENILATVGERQNNADNTNIITVSKDLAIMYPHGDYIIVYPEASTNDTNIPPKSLLKKFENDLVFMAPKANLIVNNGDTHRKKFHTHNSYPSTINTISITNANTNRIPMMLPIQSHQKN